MTASNEIPRFALRKSFFFESQSYSTINVCRNGTRTARFFWANVTDHLSLLASVTQPAQAGCVTEVPEGQGLGASVCSASSWFSSSPDIKEALPNSSCESDSKKGGDNELKIYLALDSPFFFSGIHGECDIGNAHLNEKNGKQD